MKNQYRGVDCLGKGPPKNPSNNLENKTFSDAIWRFQLVCKKSFIWVRLFESSPGQSVPPDLLGPAIPCDGL